MAPMKAMKSKVKAAAKRKGKGKGTAHPASNASPRPRDETVAEPSNATAAVQDAQETDVAATGAVAQDTTSAEPSTPKSSLGKTKQPLALPRSALTRDDVFSDFAGGDDLCDDGDSGSDEEATKRCNVCKHRKEDHKLVTFISKGHEYATCKECKNTRNRLTKLVSSDETYLKAWEAMGGQSGGRNEFISKCHHAMGDNLQAMLDKQILHTAHRSVTDDRKEGGRLLLSPEVERLYKDFGDVRCVELSNLHKANAFFEKIEDYGAKFILPRPDGGFACGHPQTIHRARPSRVARRETKEDSLYAPLGGSTPPQNVASHWQQQDQRGPEEKTSQTIGRYVRLSRKKM